MSIGFVDSGQFEWKLDNIHDLIAKNQKDNSSVESDKFTLNSRQNVKFALQLRPTSNKLWTIFRLSFCELDSIDGLFGRAFMRLTDSNYEKSYQIDKLFFVGQTDANKFLDFVIYSDVFGFNFTGLFVELRIQIYRYDQYVMAINPNLFQNNEHAQSKVFVPFPNSAFRLAFRFYPNQDTYGYLSSKLYIHCSSFDIDTQIPVCVYYCLGNNEKSGLQSFDKLNKGSTELLEYKRSSTNANPFKMKFCLAFMNDEVVHDVWSLALPAFSSYSNLQDRSELFDCSIVVGKKKIDAHKIVLTASSQLFYQEFITNKQSSISINSLSLEIARLFVNFCYTGRIKDLVGSDEELFYGAYVLKIESLKKHFEQNICQSTNYKNAVERLKLANKCNASLLKRKCLRLILANNGLVSDAIVDKLSKELETGLKV